MATTVVEIKITGDEKGYTASMQRATESTSRLSQEMRRAAEQGNQAFQKLEQAAGKSAITTRHLGTAATIVASEVGGLGRVANLASNAIITMAVSSGPAGLALAGLAAVVGFFTIRVDEARAELRLLADVELAQIMRATQGLKLEQNIRSQIKVLSSANPELEAVRQKFAEMRIEAEKFGLSLERVNQLEKLEAGKVLSKQAEEAAKKAEELAKKAEAQAKAIKTASDAVEEQTAALALQILELTDGAQATDEWKAAVMEAQAAQTVGAEKAAALTGRYRELQQALRDLRTEEEDRLARARFLTESEAAESTIRENNRREIEQEFQLKQQLGSLDVDRLRAMGLETEAMQLQLQTQIRLNQERAARLEEADITRVPGEIATIQKETTNLRTQLERVGTVSVNIGSAIFQTLQDLGSAMIAGTLKSIDVVQAASGTVLRIVGDVFQQAIGRKLVYETQLFSNLGSLPRAMNGAFMAGVSAVPGGGLFGGGIGDLILPGAGAGGGGGGGFFGSIANFFSSMPGFSLGGAGLGAGIGALMSLPGLISGGFNAQSIGGSLGSIGGGIAGSFFGPIGSIFGSLLGNFLGGFIGKLFANVPDPTAILRAQFSGIFFDAMQQVFKPGTVSVGVLSTKDLGKGKAEGIRLHVQTILEREAETWTDILNLFPLVIRETLIPGLETSNAFLNAAFSRIKFSEGGSRNIAQELEGFDLGSRQNLFIAIRGLIGEGIAQSLTTAGLSPELASMTRTQTFAPVTAAQAAGSAWAYLPFGLKPPQALSEFEGFQDAIETLIGITGGLANLSPRGATPFLTGADTTFIERALADVLKVQQGAQFTKAVEEFETEITPVLDFLKSAVAQSTELFGRGLIAALEAASESQAQAIFLQSLGEGTKDIIFQGITEAFIASAQFSDLLAPIQQTIREFTQQAIVTGAPPDLGAFRGAILPQIEAVTTGFGTLAPLIAELQRLGAELTGILTPALNQGPSNISITINGNVNDEQDVRELTRNIEAVLRGQLTPP
jgi:hypothetical protein